MKSPDEAAFKTILITSMILALVLLPFVARAECGQGHGPPAFSEIDADGDGYVSEEEFNSFRAERHAEMAAKGKKMKGTATAPSFADVDTGGDGRIDEAELTAAQQAHMKAMKEMHRDHDAGHGEHKKGMHKKMKVPSFADLDLDGDGCIDSAEFDKHHADFH